MIISSRQISIDTENVHVIMCIIIKSKIESISYLLNVLNKFIWN